MINNARRKTTMGHYKNSFQKNIEKIPKKVVTGALPPYQKNVFFWDFFLRERPERSSEWPFTTRHSALLLPALSSRFPISGFPISDFRISDFCLLVADSTCHCSMAESTTYTTSHDLDGIKAGERLAPIKTAISLKSSNLLHQCINFIIWRH